MNDLTIEGLPKAVNQLYNKLENIEKMLKENTQHSTHQKTIFSFKEGCEYLQISTSHGYKLTSQRAISFSKQGKRIFFEKTILDKFLLENKVQSVTELETEMDSFLSSNKKELL